MEIKKLKPSRGFTLIELMIVIVILGILMGTILPRLSGAQARARDTARLADLNTIAQGLELYFDDFGRYPLKYVGGVPAGPDGSDHCLDENFFEYDLFRTYFKGDEIPRAPQDSDRIVYVDLSTDLCVGSYMYLPLSDKGSMAWGYILLANMETPTKANWGYNQPPTDDIPLAYSLDTTPGEVINVIKAVTPDELLEIEGNVPSGVATLYLLVSGQ